MIPRLTSTLFIIGVFSLLSLSFFPEGIYAQVININGASLFVSPNTGTVIKDSTFDVSIFLDTNGNIVNTVQLNIKFPADKLEIVKPSGGKSFFSIWAETPTYSNTKGTASFVGGVPNGIKTDSGLVTTITFKARTTGDVKIEILPSSKVLANDGLGTNVLSGFGRGLFAVTPKPPEGVRVFSDTQPFEDKWSNNKNVLVAWEKGDGITDFSFILDNKPLTVPDNTPDSNETLKFFENVDDGISYFHIKARKEGVWGATTHFSIRIDATSPAAFKPKLEILSAAVISRALVTFSTTDSLSGVNHYEVGVIDKANDLSESPVFVETESPYQLPNAVSGDLRVIVRAIDNAGNVRDEFVDAYVPLSMKWIFTLALGVLVLLTFLHYLFGHKLISRIKEAFRLLKEEESHIIQKEPVITIQKEISKEVTLPESISEVPHEERKNIGIIPPDLPM